MRASALIPRLYRVQFGRDMISDMRQLIKSYNKAVKAWGKDVTEEQRQDAQLSMMDLTIFENVAYMSWIPAKMPKGTTPEPLTERQRVCADYRKA